MAIIILDGALAGMQPSWQFAKIVTPTLVAGLPQSLWYLAGATDLRMYRTFVSDSSIGINISP